MGLAALAACSNMEPVTLCTGDPTTVGIVGGDLQLSEPGLALPLPLTVMVTDSAGQPHAGAVVVFSVASGAGSFTQDSVVTGFDGLGSSRYTPAAGSAVDTQRVQVQVRRLCAVPSLSVLFRVVVGALTHPAGAVVAAPALGFRPFGIAVNSAGAVYVTQLDNASMSSASTSTLSLGASVVVGNAPTSVAFSPNGSTAYVANQLSSNVGVVDLASNSQVAVIPVAGNAFCVIVSPTGAKVYATTNTNHVYAISAASRTVTDSVAVGNAPCAMVFGRGDTLLYVSSFVGGTVSELNVKGALFVSRTFTLGGAPQGVAISPDGSKLYVANEAGYLNVVDLPTGAVTAPLTLGAGGFGLAATPDTLQLYVTLPSAGAVAVVDRASLTLVKTMTPGGKPRRVAFSPDGLTAVVANEAGSVIFIR